MYSVHTITQATSLRQKYRLTQKSFATVKEEIKQNIRATSAKLRRYTQRINQYKINKTFATNEGQVYKQFENKQQANIAVTEEMSTEIRNFWTNIWGDSVTHNSSAKWINDIQATTNTQADITISTNDVTQQLKSTANWKAPGQDYIHAYWLKQFTAIHGRLAYQLQQCLNNGRMPQSIVTGRTTLIVKNKANGASPNNLRPITCLNNIYKLLTGILANKTYNHLQYNNIIPIEQKGGQRNCRGAKDHLLINKTILYTCRQHQRNLHMAWIDYRKAYDMLPHSWILHTLRTYGVANNTHTFVQNIMTKWQTEMYFNKRALGNVKINRGIYQGDSLSPLLFVIALVPLTAILNSLKSGYKIPQTQTKINHLLYMDDLKLYTNTQKQLTSMLNTVNTFTKDIKMEFGLNKCGTVAIHKGTSMDEAVHNLMDGNSLPLVGKDGYKYLGIFENITIMQLHTTTTIIIIIIIIN